MTIWVSEQTRRWTIWDSEYERHVGHGIYSVWPVGNQCRVDIRLRLHYEKLMRIHFKCGCFMVVSCKFTHEEMALSCCDKHERPNATIEDLGPMEVESVELADRR